MDWNWFLSSVAQSAAAIVAIGAAFMVSRVLSAEAAHAAREESVRILLLKSRRLVEQTQAADFAGHVQEVLDDELDWLESEIMHGTPGDEVPTDPYEWLARLSLSAYQAPESAVRAISERLASTRERRDVEQEKRGRRSVSGWPSLDLPFIESDDIRADRRASNRERRSRLAAESQNLQRLDLEVTAHIRDLKSWEETRTAEPNILRMTLAGLGAIFSMSVLLPLVLLPQPSQSSNPTIHAHGITEKALTLVPLAVGFYGLLLMLDRVMHGMKPDSSTLVAVRYYQTKDVYSPYLDIGDSARSGGVGGSAGP